jgi:hypothetical protein
VLSKPLFLIKPAPRTIAVNDKLPQESLGA